MTAKIASKTRVYRDMKKFLNEVIYIIKDFPKEQRYVVGDRIERTAIDSLHVIARVYMGKDLKMRIADMVELQSNLELLNTLIEIAGEHQWIKGRGKFQAPVAEPWVLVQYQFSCSCVAPLIFDKA